jgi:hypothetical protein
MKLSFTKLDNLKTQFKIIIVLVMIDMFTKHIFQKKFELCSTKSQKNKECPIGNLSGTAGKGIVFEYCFIIKD